MRRLALFGVLGFALAAPVLGETPPPPAAPCIAGTDIRQSHLLGLWRATFDGLPRGATLLLEKHPELSESVRGAINRNGDRAMLAGDVDAGEFTLEESVDGVRIVATWTGTVIDSACGREIRGDWKSAGDAKARAFVLRKAE